MKTLKKDSYETDREFVDRILSEVKKNRECKIYKLELERFLSYIAIKKFNRLTFSIAYDSQSEMVIIHTSIIENLIEPKEMQSSLKFDFFSMPCYNLNCIFNKYENNTYTCTKHFKYNLCQLRQLKPIVL